MLDRITCASGRTRTCNLPIRRYSRLGALCDRAFQQIVGVRRDKNYQLTSTGDCPPTLRTLAPAARPLTAVWSAVAASASGYVAAIWSESWPFASAATIAARRFPSDRT